MLWNCLGIFLGNQMFQDIMTYLDHVLAETCLVNDMKDIYIYNFTKHTKIFAVELFRNFFFKNRKSQIIMKY